MKDKNLPAKHHRAQYVPNRKPNFDAISTRTSSSFDIHSCHQDSHLVWSSTVCIRSIISMHENNLKETIGEEYQ